jgi:hypothetical protein
MHAYRGGSAARARVLYMFRSPSHLKVGRTALDAEVVEALEHTHPDLTFDWTAIVREPAVAAPMKDARRDRPWREARGARPAAPPAPKPAAAESRQVPVELTDESLLGRTLGARDAARLRTAYQQVLERITRRAPTPDERTRLTEQVLRLNPDEWPDEPAIRAAAVTAEAALAAVAAELPRRRRGRRGGRHRDREDGSSAIMRTQPIQEDQPPLHEIHHEDALALSELPPLQPAMADARPDGDHGDDRGGAGADAPDAGAAEAARDAAAGHTDADRTDVPRGH